MGSGEADGESPVSPGSRAHWRPELLNPKNGASNGLDELKGSFEKRVPFWVEGWRPHSFVFRNGKLVYHNRGKTDRPTGVLDFNLLHFDVYCSWEADDVQDVKEAEESAKTEGLGCGCRETPQDADVVYLRPTDFPQKVFAFRGPTREIRALAERTKRYADAVRPNALKDMLSSANFWRFPFIHESEMIEQAESGDIMLFSGKDRPCAVTRVLTNSEYDHVGLLLRQANGNLLLLEATGDQGVDIVSWRHFKRAGWHKLYIRLAVRKVYFDRTTARLMALENYIHKVLGSSYSLNPSKLMRSNSGTFDKDGRQIGGGAENDADRTFFCSELVAACLKRCGVLEGSRPSTNYYPSSFSQDSFRGLPLQGHVSMGEEQVVVYDA
eukprot:NODE_9852_length_1394_cov_9.374901.p1 GENE.NODE_9852_length_1394_cov_9.374901~~NODE_9852_length_1394_cov_9.374901.p1  ORF type:complete len:406 (-),score=104.07 NODE_9852_length_1394_cov_9.374901:177-1322(-)